MARENNRTSKEREKVSSKIATALGITQSSIVNASQIELISNREATVDGCMGILEYSGEIIRINTGTTVVKFSGRDLNIRSMSEKNVWITGYILSVEFLG